MKNKILVIAVHPDDETLGCGGTLLKHKANGDEIHWLICTTIDEKHSYYEVREKEIAAVSKLYNFDSVHNLRLKTMQVDQYSMSELIGKISKVFNDLKPNIIYLPFMGDIHSDHRRIFEASYSCTKSFRYPFIKQVYMMEVLSETELALPFGSNNFIPTRFVDISDFMEEKLNIMSIYVSELGEHPFPRSNKIIEALARYRGAMSQCSYAESFSIVKIIC